MNEAGYLWARAPMSTVVEPIQQIVCLVTAVSS